METVEQRNWSGEFLMAQLPIVIWPNPLLRTACTPITDFGSSLQKLLDDMTETATLAHAAGLAAPQIGVTQAVMLVKIGEFFKEFINPVLSPIGTDKILVHEGCLSVPGYTIPVKRYRNVSVTAYNRIGEPFTFDSSNDSGYQDPPVSACLQHEADHLMGKTFMDGLSELKRSRAEQSMRKWLKRHRT